MFEHILVGADPELFVRNPNSGKFVSGHRLIKGTKEKPFPVDKGAIQVDGMALEYNIHPAASAQVFVENNLAVLGRLTDDVRAQGYELVATPVADFDEDVFDETPPKARELGCIPDFNAWIADINPPPNGDRPFRTASGHVHIGWTHGLDINDPDHFATCCEVAKQMDYYLGIQSLLWDKDGGRRRELYGKAGCFRPKPYGVEYRTMSNAWVGSEPHMRWIYFAIRLAMHDLEEGKRAEERWGDDARSIIDENILDWPGQFNIDVGVPRPPVLKAA